MLMSCDICCPSYLWCLLHYNCVHQFLQCFSNSSTMCVTFLVSCIFLLCQLFVLLHHHSVKLGNKCLRVSSVYIISHYTGIIVSYKKKKIKMVDGGIPLSSMFIQHERLLVIRFQMSISSVLQILRLLKGYVRLALPASSLAERASCGFIVFFKQICAVAMMALIEIIETS